MDGKACIGCGSFLPRLSFYANSCSRDGRGPRCKECVKAAVRANRAANLERYQAYDRDRANRPDRVAARAAYAKTAQGKAARLAGGKAWVLRNGDKRQAYVKLGNALRDGKITRAEACECGATGRMHAHHDDYTKPLSVRWLCVPCHTALHVAINAQRRQQTPEFR